MRLLLVATLVAGILPVAAAPADVAGPDESIGQAFGPIAAGTLYSGAFKSATDVDYLAFDVTAPGQTLHFDVTNTVHGCTSPDLTGCPVYATLIDGAEHQLGGEGSSAGTGPVSEDSSSDVIDWTFDAPGRYYVAMDSDGDQPTYGLQYRVVAPGAAGTADGGGGSAGGGAGGGSMGNSPAAPGSGRPPGSSVPGPGPGRPIASLRVAARQRGAVLRGRLHVGRALRRLTISLEVPGVRPGSRAVAVEHLGAVGPGRRTVRLRLDAGARRALARRGRLAVRLRVVAVPVAGATQAVRRSVKLVRR